MFAHFLCSIYRAAYLSLHTPFNIRHGATSKDPPYVRKTGSEKPGSSFFFIYHQLKIYNTRYVLVLNYLQNTFRYYNYNTTTSNMSCLPRGFRKEKKTKKRNDIELYSKRKFRRKGTWWLLDGWQKFERIESNRPVSWIKRRVNSRIFLLISSGKSLLTYYHALTVALKLRLMGC